MKLKKFGLFRAGALIAVGVFLGRGAHADTTLTFDSAPSSSNGDVLSDCVPPQVNNPNAPPGITNFGNYAAASTPGVQVSGFGTPNIGITWYSDNYPDTRWEYYNKDFAPWGNVAGGSGAVQLQGCFVGTAEELIFTPNNPAAAVQLKSFNFFPYYDAVTDTNVYGGLERYTFNISVLSGKTVVSGPTMFTFTSDGTTNHPVNLNYTGTPGQTLKLKLARMASTLGAGEIEGTAYSIAVDKIAFAQTPQTTFPAGPQVVSVTPADESKGFAAIASPPYAASITNGPTLTVAAPIQLKLDGIPVSPAPTISSSGGLTNVSYPGAAGLLSSGAHVYTLTYADNLGGIYTNETVFYATYQTLPPSYASPPGSGSHPGFTFRTVAVNQDTTNTIAASIARAKAQLAGTLIDVSTGQPFTNAATLGTNSDGSFNIDTVLNFTDNGAAGNFLNDTEFPGLDAGPYNWFSTEALLYLDLPAGFHRFGVNSDDGFEVNALAPQGVSGAPIVLGSWDGTRGASDTLFDFLVQTSGVYIFQVIYFESTQAASEEFFSVTNLTTGDKVLINDLSDAGAIRSYRVIPPRITSIVRSGSNVILQWAYGLGPFQVQFKSAINGPTWTNVGSATSNRTASIPILPGAGFFRVVGSP